MGKITSIQIKVPQETTLPDGNYVGVWGGYIIELQHGGKTYELKTEEGVRGMGFKVVVTIINGTATYKSINN